MLDELVKNLNSKGIKKIGTLQIPHHGSIENFNPQILSRLKPEFTIVSYGRNNQYGHPSDKVLSDILSLHIPLYHIDDDIKSIVVQSNKPFSNPI